MTLAQRNQHSGNGEGEGGRQVPTVPSREHARGCPLGTMNANGLLRTVCLLICLGGERPS